jgi:pyruvate/2-oxoglutarate dehydrogenase complex dihydrolipoamide acyltransferase (E2) component
MKTAVEWLIDMLITENEVTLKGENFKLFEMAKAMEKEQIMNAWIATDNELQRIAAEQYYNETFKK